MGRWPTAVQGRLTAGILCIGGIAEDGVTCSRVRRDRFLRGFPLSSVWSGNSLVVSGRRTHQGIHLVLTTPAVDFRFGLWPLRGVVFEAACRFAALFFFASSTCAQSFKTQCMISVFFVALPFGRNAAERTPTLPNGVSASSRSALPRPGDPQHAATACSAATRQAFVSVHVQVRVRVGRRIV